MKKHRYQKTMYNYCTPLFEGQALVRLKEWGTIREISDKVFSEQNYYGLATFFEVRVLDHYRGMDYEET